ncbi:MAG TPA: hypothetical protein VK826_03660 [Bacteroidia bacterium]|nr:hypothetical protein [Bacteroidia bacterium]
MDNDNIPTDSDADALAQSVTVAANRSWQDTGVNVAANNTVYLADQNGSWTANPAFGSYGANGNPTVKGKLLYTLPGANEGALIGRIGSTVFLFGMGGVAPAGLSGRLNMCINDDLNAVYGQGLADNSGTLSMCVFVQ